MDSGQRYAGAPTTDAPWARAATETPPIELPEPLTPLVVVTIDTNEDTTGAGLTAEDRAWRVVSVTGSDRCGADVKHALQEGLRAGGRCIVVWPRELGRWQATMPTIVRPILTRRADLVFPGFSTEAGSVGLRPLPARFARPLLGLRCALVNYGPLAVTRRALDLVPFEANDDGRLFLLQLLAQSRHFALEAAPCLLSAPQYEALAQLGHSTPPRALRQLLCGIEFLAHRWGIADSPRFQPPQMAYVSRWMISKGGT